jgi:hypothetical protein
MGSHTRVVEAIDAGAREIREDAALQIKQVQARCDLELAKLKRAKLALLGSTEVDRGSNEVRRATEAKRKRSRRKGRISTSAKSVAERRDSVFRFISESAEPVASGELVKGLGISTHAVHTALQQLLKERRITRIGSSVSTRYCARTGLHPLVARESGPRGTLQGRIVTTIGDRSYASAEELGQALGEPVERMVEVCGALQAEGEIRMDRRDGRPVYILQTAA